MKLSVVIASRGDSYGGDQVTKVSKLISRLKRRLDRLIPNDYEIVLVDYNYVHDRQFVKILKHNLRGHIKIVTVGKDATHPSASSENPFIEYHAKNIGIQSASGSQILVINTDVFITTSLMRACIDRPYLNESYLRADRTDFFFGKGTLIPKWYVKVRNGIRESEPIAYKFPSKRFFLGSSAFPDESVANGFIIGPPQGIKDHFIGGAHGPAAGDFICAPKASWDRIKGYREDRYISHMGDSHLLCGFFSLGLRQIILKGPFRLIHREHPRPIDHKAGWTQQDWEDFKGEFKSIQLKKTPYPTLGRTWTIN